jgi:hypothetical protein
MGAWHEDNRFHDIARFELLLAELRLPGIKLMWATLAEQAGTEG